MWIGVAAIRLVVLCMGLVDARGLFRSEKSSNRPSLVDLDVSLESEEADFYVRHGRNGKVVALKKYLEVPSPPVKVVKRMDPKSDYKLNQMVMSRSFSKLLDKLGDVRHVKSSEEEDQAMALLKVRIQESTESSVEYKDDLEDGKVGPRDHIGIAQKWFPTLLRRAIDSMMQNISKHDVNHLVEQLSSGTWSIEEVDESEKMLVNQKMTDSTLASDSSRVVGQESWSEEPIKLKRSNCQTCGVEHEPNGVPCVVNIFNNSHIGYLILKPAYNVSGDNASSLLEKPFIGHLPQTLNLSFILPSCNIPCLNIPSNDVASTPTLIPEDCTTPSTTTSTTTTTTTIKPTTCQPSANTAYICPQGSIAHCQPIYCPHYPLPAVNHPRSVMYPWLKHHKEDLKQPYHLAASDEYDERAVYDRFKNFRYGLVGDCSSAEDDTGVVSTVVKRAPQLRDSSDSSKQLKNTLAKFRLSLADSERPAGVKSSGSHSSNRHKTKSDPPRGERVQQKSKNYEPTAKSQKRTSKTTTDPDFYRF